MEAKEELGKSDISIEQRLDLIESKIEQTKKNLAKNVSMENLKLQKERISAQLSPMTQKFAKRLFGGSSGLSKEEIEAGFERLAKVTQK